MSDCSTELQSSRKAAIEHYFIVGYQKPCKPKPNISFCGRVAPMGLAPAHSTLNVMGRGRPWPSSCRNMTKSLVDLLPYPGPEVIIAKMILLHLFIRWLIRWNVTSKRTAGSCNDICIYNNCNTRSDNSARGNKTYQLPTGAGEDFLAGSERYKVKEIEVYAVLK